VGRLQRDLKQHTPFSGPAEEAYLNLVRTADHLTREVAGVLKPHDLSETQYNVLRILRGAGTSGHACSEIGSRLVTRDPDVTRLLDRLEKRGLIGRSREHPDRRVVTTRITPAGLALLDALDGPVRQAVEGLLAHVPASRLRSLSSLLEESRRSAAETPAAATRAATKTRPSRPRTARRHA
jgi:DNA-binding MarR family transcriptional regulator